MMFWLYLAIMSYIFLLGVTIGSFLNVVVYRLPKKISIAKGRSYCPACGTRIRNYDLIPILSYLILGGRCRTCKTRISLRYPLVELSAGLMALLVFQINGLNFESLLLFALGSVLLAASLIDYDTMTIPDSLIVSLLPLAAAFFLADPETTLLSRLIGTAAISLPMYLSLYLKEDSFGGADIKLFAVLGFILGWQKILLTMFIAAVLGSVFGIIFLIIKKEKIGGKQIPFGPYICIAAFLSLLAGDRIISWYLGFFGLGN